jgi:hypothetical protein
MERLINSSLERGWREGNEGKKGERNGEWVQELETLVGRPETPSTTSGGSLSCRPPLESPHRQTFDLLPVSTMKGAGTARESLKGEWKLLRRLDSPKATQR